MDIFSLTLPAEFKAHDSTQHAVPIQVDSKQNN